MNYVFTVKALIMTTSHDVFRGLPTTDFFALQLKAAAFGAGRYVWFIAKSNFDGNWNQFISMIY